VPAQTRAAEVAPFTVLVGLEAAGNEGNDAWDDFLDGLKARGLRPPLLVISDGAAGLVGAIGRNLSKSLRQRCLIHRSATFWPRCRRTPRPR